MTKQLTIKLNQERFEPIFNDLREFGFKLFQSNSALSAFSIWFLWWFTHNKLPSGQTVFENFCRSRDKSVEECILMCMKDYCESTAAK
jgi:hypothetical protein